jgi:1,2-diacylglycerol 3-beta-glucosyltransferase
MVHSLLAALAIAASAASLAIAAYLALLTVAAALAARGPGARRAPATRFTILVPAHDEERMIGDLLQSLRAIDYPTHLVTTWVVADNCSDATATLAASAGARVLERFDTVNRGKGHALDALIEAVEAGGESCDAYVFIDADSQVSANLLSSFDRAFQDGAKAMQAHYAIARDGASTGVLVRSAAMLLVNFVRPLGRERLGWSAGIKGTGMAVARPLARDLRWGGSLAEDAEYHVKLMLRGARVAFVRDALVTAHIPATLAGAREQNRRWEAGRLAAARSFVPALLRASARGNPLPCLDAAADLLVPPLSIVVAWMLATLALSAVVSPAGVTLSLWAIGLLAFHVLAGMAVAGASASQFKALVLAPVMIAWKIAIYASVLARRGPTRWVRTQRDE